MLVVFQPEIIQPIVIQPSISYEEQNMQGTFLRLAPSRFFGTPSEDAYEFLTDYKNRLHGSGLVETCGVD